MAKSRKNDRNRAACKIYKVQDKARSNKLRKMRRTLKNQPDNVILATQIRKLEA